MLNLNIFVFIIFRRRYRVYYVQNELYCGFKYLFVNIIYFFGEVSKWVLGKRNLLYFLKKKYVK